jgi:hypothetical protein
MKFKVPEFEGKVINFADLDEIMQAAGFDSQWDYERITYDFKFVDEADTDAYAYYFRVPAHIHEGEIPKNSAKVYMLAPYLGRHYYPHGIEYDEVFPEWIVNKCNQKLEQIVEKIKADVVS